jgi:ribosomal protein S20
MSCMRRNGYYLSSIEPFMKKLKESIENENDEDIKRDLRKGNEVTIIM